MKPNLQSMRRKCSTSIWTKRESLSRRALQWIIELSVSKTGWKAVVRIRMSGFSSRKKVTKVLKGPAGFGLIMNMTMNLILGLVLSVVVLSTIQGLPGNEGLPIFTPVSFFVGAVQAMIVGVFVGDLFPALQWGQKLAGALHVKNKVGAHFIVSLVLAFVMATCITFLCMFLNNFQTGGMQMVIGGWLAIYPVTLGCAYPLVLVALPLVMKMATSISGFNPATAHAPEMPGDAVLQMQ